ncbi:hypothetical protein AcV5_009188 [Taiwanofungus camphoratus]|nr:hypothetical protein AcV5_009188 [Antrodia cinnamomea]
MARCAVSVAFVRVYGARSASTSRTPPAFDVDAMEIRKHTYVRRHAPAHTRLSRRRDTYGDAGHPCSIQPSQSPSFLDPQFRARATPSPGPPVSCAVPAWELQQHTGRSHFPCPSREPGRVSRPARCTVSRTTDDGAFTGSTTHALRGSSTPCQRVTYALVRRARGGVDGAALGDGASAPGVR